ncbi:hypothetical protein DPX16_5541 [Anabarilius grahami]|uniref:Uncharacterized protein n=1 Tax=Anabarilius grahami TaxID=495550 RepID=A0A3N0YB52_ANAGA|nr:hypothetical protein DPX16_5541 [Anabarilius grahami]
MEILKLVLFLCLAVGLINCVQLTESNRLIYTMEDLSSMVYRGPVEDEQFLKAIKDIRRGPRPDGTAKNKLNKRGSRGGVKQWVKLRGNKPPLLVITLINARSINNKIKFLLKWNLTVILMEQSPLPYGNLSGLRVEIHLGTMEGVASGLGTKERFASGLGTILGSDQKSISQKSSRSSGEDLGMVSVFAEGLGISAAILTEGSDVTAGILTEGSGVASAISRRGSGVEVISRRGSGMAAILRRGSGEAAIFGQGSRMVAILITALRTWGFAGG